MNNNLINTIGKTDEELSKIQIDYLKEKKTEYIEKLYNAEIDSREDILDIFQNNAPILDIDN